MPLIKRLSSKHAFPGVSAGRYGSILENGRASAKIDSDSSPLPFGGRETQRADHANNFISPEPRAQHNYIDRSLGHHDWLARKPIRCPDDGRPSEHRRELYCSLTKVQPAKGHLTA